MATTSESIDYSTFRSEPSFTDVKYTISNLLDCWKRKKPKSYSHCITAESKRLLEQLTWDDMLATGVREMEGGVTYVTYKYDDRSILVTVAAKYKHNSLECTLIKLVVGEYPTEEIVDFIVMPNGNVVTRETAGPIAERFHHESFRK